MNNNMRIRIEKVCGKNYSYNDVPTYIREREKKQREMELLLARQRKAFPLKGLGIRGI